MKWLHNKLKFLWIIIKKLLEYLGSDIWPIPYPKCCISLNSVCLREASWFLHIAHIFQTDWGWSLLYPLHTQFWRVFWATVILLHSSCAHVLTKLPRLLPSGERKFVRTLKNNQGRLNPALNRKKCWTMAL